MTHKEYLEQLTDPDCTYDRADLATRLQRHSGMSMSCYIAICVKSEVDPAENTLAVCVNTKKAHCLTFGHRETGELGVHMFTNPVICSMAMLSMFESGGGPDELEWDIVPVMMLANWDENVLQLHEMGLLDSGGDLIMKSTVVDAGTLAEDLSHDEIEQIIKEKGNQEINLFMDGQQITNNEDEKPDWVSAAAQFLDSLLKSEKDNPFGEDSNWRKNIQ